MIQQILHEAFVWAALAIAAGAIQFVFALGVKTDYHGIISQVLFGLVLVVLYAFITEDAWTVPVVMIGCLLGSGLAHLVDQLRACGAVNALREMLGPHFAGMDLAIGQ